MKSETLLLNKGLFLQQFRTIGWVTIFFTLVLLITLPLSILVQQTAFPVDGGSSMYTGSFNPLYDFSGIFQLVIFYFFPVIIAVILSFYLTKASSMDFMHALPFKRRTLLYHTYVSGITAIALPVLTTALTLMLLNPFLPASFYTAGDVAEWSLFALTASVFLYVIAILIGMFVGTAFMQAALTYVVLTAPALLVMLIIANARFYINGLALDAYAENLFNYGIFFIRLVILTDTPFTWIEAVIYGVIMIVAFAVTFFAYEKRPGESKEQTIVFPFFRYLFLYSLTLLAMLVTGFYFSEIQNGSISWSAFGYVLGAFIGYTVLQMILQRTVRLSWPWKGFVSYIAAVIILMIPAGAFGAFYEQNIPDADTIESVQLNSYVFPMTDDEQDQWIENRETITTIVNIHEQLINSKTVSTAEAIPFKVTYRLTDGSTLTREYNVEAEELSGLTENLRSQNAFKQAYEPVLQVKDTSSVESIMFTTSFTNDSPFSLSTEDSREIYERLLLDVSENQSSIFDDYSPGKIAAGYLTISTSEFDYPLEINLGSSYTNTLAWFEENGYSDNLFIPENIKQATVFKIDGDPEFFNTETDLDSLAQLPYKQFTTSSSEEIKELFEAESFYQSEEYAVILESRLNSSLVTLYISEENAPAFLREAGL